MDANNGQLELARTIIERTGHSLFLTGKAGTGKTTFLKELVASSRKRMIVTAPTGIAAINAGGVTLHSFFQLDFGPFVPGAVTKSSAAKPRHSFGKQKIKMIRGLDLLVIDEISMVRADVLDAVDAVLRRFRDRNAPFGGIQLLLIGDLQQLPPVVVDSERKILEANYSSPYFFSSHALGELDYVTIELTKVFRQNDEKFLSLLNAVRENRVDSSIIQALNSRHLPGFNPDDSERYIRLTTHNRMADEINSCRMEQLPGKPYVFEAKIEGNFPESSFPVPQFLTLKEGAQVMFVKNDTGQERLFFNGMLGTITSIDEDGVYVMPAYGDHPIAVEQAEWKNVKYEIDEDKNEIKEKSDGVFRQLPLKPAWAITIHKSQGLTFEKAIIDAALSFTHGQTYVALSRCRNLKGLVLDRPISQSSIICDPTVAGFIKSHVEQEISSENIDALSHAYYINLIGEMFNFRPLFNMLEGVERLLKENFVRVYPTFVAEFSQKIDTYREELAGVGQRFQVRILQLDREANGEDNNPKLLQRVKDAAAYFEKKITDLSTLISNIPADHDNKSVKNKMRDRIEMIEDFLAVKSSLLTTFVIEDFSIELYHDMKARGALRNTSKSKNSHVEIQSQFSQDNLHPILFDTLSAWRRSKANELNVPAFTIAYTKTLLAVSNYLPVSYDELGRLPGVGPAMIKKFGDEILDIVDSFVNRYADNIERLPIPQSKKKQRKHKTVKG